MNSIPFSRPSPKALLALIIVTSATGGVSLVLLCVDALKIYGVALFFGVPFTVGFFNALIVRALLPAYGLKASFAFAQAAVLLAALLLFVLAVDGLVCLLLAYPIVFVAASLGAVLGYELADLGMPGPSIGAGLSLLIGLPLLLGFESRRSNQLPMHEVTSSVHVEAPATRVWKEVIAFDRIVAKPEGIFRWGIAYPIEARIEGQGVGAVRHCVFSTGAFLEPITRWEEPSLLEFDVIENPPPMKEWSIYPGLEPAHLNTVFVSDHGRFHLVSEGAVTRLEGTTWYTQALFPDFYWSLFSDAIIHRIHMRVLDHIRTQAETSIRPG